MNRLVEIRSYRLKPGGGARFHELVVTKSIPLLHARGMAVVAFGQSLRDPDAYFLMRAYDDLERLAPSRMRSVQPTIGAKERERRSSS